jgi:hypothetical protein
MAYTEKLLPVEALLGMWQNRRQQETQDTSAMKEREKLQNEMLRKQIEMADWNMIKEKSPDTMTVKTGSGAMAGEPGFTEKRFLSDVPGYISGTPGAQVFAEKMATGRAMLDAMSRGGSTARQEPGGGTQEPSMTYTGPDHSQNSTVDIANALGQLYRPGGEDIPQQPQTMADALADEQQNKAGYESLIKEKYSMPSPETTNNLMANTDPVAAAIAKRDADNRVFSDLYMSGAAPLPKTLRPEDQLNLVNQKKAKEKTEKLPETINNTRSKLKGTVGFDELYPDRQKYLMAEVANIVRQTGGQPDLYAIVSAELERQTAEAAKKKSTTK